MEGELFDLQEAVEGATRTSQIITWTRNDGSKLDLTGAVLEGTITHDRSGSTRLITGALTPLEPRDSDANIGRFTWAYSFDDVLNPGRYTVRFRAVYGANNDATFAASWKVHPYPEAEL